MLTDIVPALNVDGKFIANPLVETGRITDEYGRLVFGKQKVGDAFKAGQELMKQGKIDLSLLDEKVEGLCTRLLYTFPDCTTKTVEELRKPKLDAWNRNKENSRAWLALNMMAEARAGFRAFNEGTRETGREVDFIELRRALAANARWDDELTADIMPGAAQRRALCAGLPWTDEAASAAR
jgi:6-oxo-cyclohex-1-ene-carbonyl-CoA hydrolase